MAESNATESSQSLSVANMKPGEEPKHQTTGFLDLPPEIRNMIYSYYIIADMVASRPYIRNQTHSYMNEWLAPGLLMTCCQIFREALHIYLNNFQTYHLSLSKRRKKTKKSGRLISPATRRWLTMAGDALQVKSLTLNMLLRHDVDESNHQSVMATLEIHDAGKAAMKLDMIGEDYFEAYHHLTVAVCRHVNNVLRTKQIKALNFKDIEKLVEFMRPRLWNKHSLQF